MGEIKNEKYKTFDEQLAELPPEFAIFMEQYREDHFMDLINLIDKEFNLSEELKEMTVDEQNKIVEIFKVFHNFGFYGGVSYTLDPQQRYIQKYVSTENK